MNPAQRTVGSWILAAFLERGCGPATAPPPEPVRRERPLTPEELRAFRGPSARIHFLRRRRGEEGPVAGSASASSEPASTPVAAAGTGSTASRPAVTATAARLLAFPARTGH